MNELKKLTKDEALEVCAKINHFALEGVKMITDFDQVIGAIPKKFISQNNTKYYGVLPVIKKNGEWRISDGTTRVEIVSVHEVLFDPFNRTNESDEPTFQIKGTASGHAIKVYD